MVCLVFAMMLLFARNYISTRYEAKVTEMKFTNPTLFSAMTNIQPISSLQRLLGAMGLTLTTAGMLILLYVAATLF
jgi:hypothetical protein